MTHHRHTQVCVWGAGGHCRLTGARSHAVPCISLLCVWCLSGFRNDHNVAQRACAARPRRDPSHPVPKYANLVMCGRQPVKQPVALSSPRRRNMMCGQATGPSVWNGVHEPCCFPVVPYRLRGPKGDLRRFFIFHILRGDRESQRNDPKWSNLVKSSPSHFNHIFTLEGDKIVRVKVQVASLSS
jgi:hypothetical protein